MKLKWQNIELFLISILALYLEMLFIRWIGTEISIFAYLQNTILVVCFMGLGLGCFASRIESDLSESLPSLLFLVLLLSLSGISNFSLSISHCLHALGDFHIWNFGLSGGLLTRSISVIMGLIFSLLLMLFVWQLFVPIGQKLGRLLDQNPNPIKAYSLNISGSLVGIWLYVVLSALSAPPSAWLIIVFFIFLFFMYRSAVVKAKHYIMLFFTVLLPFTTAFVPDVSDIVWSPYQKLVVKDVSSLGKAAAKYLIEVNGTSFQLILDLSNNKKISALEKVNNGVQKWSSYDLPLLLHPAPKKMLVVGAGTGNDVAAALRHGVEKITAVEIDPSIISIGRDLHPERPYDSDKVKIIVDDARSFFESTNEKFDIISFGLLDSHTMTSMTNMRLDNYVYTEESLKKAKSLLKEGGIITLNFWIPRDFIADRFAVILNDVFKEHPLVIPMDEADKNSGPIVFIAGKIQNIKDQIKANKGLEQYILSLKAKRKVNLKFNTLKITDDWPYLYLPIKRIPFLHYLFALIMLILFILSIKRLRMQEVFQNIDRSLWHFFFLGAAFLLLEVQNISKAAVVFGNTWQVNAIIVSAVFIMILLANLIAAKWPMISDLPVYFLLFVSCFGLYYIDLADFTFLTFFNKVLTVGAFTTLPMFFGGVIFIKSFLHAPEKDSAFGANLMGSLIGGITQSVTFITGIKSLLIIVFIFYFAAMLCRFKHSKRITISL
jgi:spermidine synthase